MKWYNLAPLLSVLAFGVILTPGCEPQEPLETETEAPTTESPTTSTGETGVTRDYEDNAENDQEDGVTNESIHIDRDPDMEPTEPLE